MWPYLESVAEYSDKGFPTESTDMNAKAFITSRHLQLRPQMLCCSSKTLKARLRFTNPTVTIMSRYITIIFGYSSLTDL